MYEQPDTNRMISNEITDQTPTKADETGNELKPIKSRYTLYRYRFVILTLYCLLNISNITCWISLQPVGGLIQLVYSKNATEVNLLTLVYAIVALVLILPSSFIFDKMGCRLGMSIGAVFLVIGMWVKVASYYNFWFLIVG